MSMNIFVLFRVAFLSNHISEIVARNTLFYAYNSERNNLNLYPL